MIVVHADWGTNPAKQQVAAARRDSAGRWCAYAPIQTGVGGSLRRRLHVDESEPVVMIGFDFPIGIPRAYAARAGITSFPEFLHEAGHGVWADFFEVADSPDEVCVERPFYPQTYMPKGAKKRSHLTEGLGIDYEDLLRRCDVASAGRGAACAIFWTCGGNQVGKGAISGWKLLQQEPMASTPIWPFDGPLDDLLSAPGTVVVETYPTECSRQLGFGPVIGKRQQAVRRSHATSIIGVTRQLGVDLEPKLESQIQDGFGSAANGDDKFDAVIGLLGMLNVVIGDRSPGSPLTTPRCQRSRGG